MGLSDYLPDFGDPNQMAVWGALGGLAQSAAPQPGVKGMGALSALGGIAGNVIGGGVRGAAGAQEYNKVKNYATAEDLANQQAAAIAPYNASNAQIGNQVNQLNLQKQQTLQPLQLQYAQKMMGGAGNVPGSLAASPTAGNSPADNLYGQALQTALVSGDMSKASSVYQSWAEHNVQLAGDIERAKAQNSVNQTPNGPQFGVSGLPGTGSAQPSAGNTQPPIVPVQTAQLPPPPNPQQAQAPIGSSSAIPQVNASQLNAPNQPINTSDGIPLPGVSNVPPAKASSFVASDGKPYVPAAVNLPLRPADPSGTPKYNTQNTTTGVNQTKEFQAADVKGDASIAEGATNTNQMLSRLHDIGSAFQSAKAGTPLSIDPDLANQAIAMGLIKDKGQINDVAQYQRVLSDLAVETINQIKSAQAGSSESRVMNSELKGIQGKMADPHLQPQAIQSILSLSQGLGNYNKDLAQGWNAIGGLGNRVADGFTLRPTAYTQQFAQTHDLDGYINQAKQQIGPLAGMAGNPLDSARAAIAKGADPVKVKARLQANNIDPSGL